MRPTAAILALATDEEHQRLSQIRCFPTFFVNGHEELHAGTSVSILDQVDAAYPNPNVFTIEVFDTFHPRPLKFTGNPLCGAIVGWTKQHAE
ncbi:MAG: hypothetical protein ABI442_13700 [Gemmatimonadaceae bacterium]